MRNFKKLIVMLIIMSFIVTTVFPIYSFADTTNPGDSTLKTGITDTTKASADLNAQIESVMKAIQENYYKDVTADQLKAGAMKGMFEVLDKHSDYFTSDEYKEFMNGITGEITGIGVNVEKNADGGIRVIAPIEGSEAYKAGIKSGDIIISVDGVDISTYALDKAVTLIRGAENTNVKIGIKRAGSDGIKYFTITRKVIEVNPVNYKMMSDGIGYIRISQFNGHALANVHDALKVMKDKNVKGIIFDLRGNPGGLLSEVIQICQELIPSGPIVHIQQKGVITATYGSELEKAPFKLVVLVDGGSASASEIMAGAIKDSGAGILVGDKTYGKGTVQQIYSGASGTGYKITIANYLTPSKFSLDGIGLTPNVMVKYNLADKLKTYSPMSLKGTIKFKALSLDVQGMQQRLNTLGVAKLNTNGVFNGETLKGVIAFQKTHKLKTDGIMNPSDLKALELSFEAKIKKNDPQLDRAVKEMKKILNK